MRRFTTGSSSIPHRVDSDFHGSCTRNTTLRTHKQTDEESSSSSETMLWLLCCEAFQRIIPWKDLCYTSFHCKLLVITKVPTDDDEHYAEGKNPPPLRAVIDLPQQPFVIFGCVGAFAPKSN